jgi:hypothetical protein
VSWSELTLKHFKGPEYHFDHISCDLPVEGARVWVRSSSVEGNATVRIHWHYEDCVLDVDLDDGRRVSIHPPFGDDVVPIIEPWTVLSGAAIAYKAKSKESNELARVFSLSSVVVTWRH